MPKVCQNKACGSARIMQFSGKCSDLFSSRMLDTGVEYNGYVPTDIPPFKNSYGDYVQGDLCLDCGQLQGRWPCKKSMIEKSKKDRDE